MIRILHVVSGLGGGGVEAMLYNYYIHMDKKAVQFDFIVHDPDIGILEQKFKELGSDIYHVTPKKVSIIKNAREINQVIKSGKYDIVHSHQNSSSFLALYIAKRNHVKIRISHSHVGFANQRISEKLFELPFKMLNKHFSTDWFACSAMAGRWLFGKEDRNKKVSIINNAIDTNRFKFYTELRQKIRDEFNWNDKFVIGNVARFFPEKNHLFLFKIFLEIRKRERSAILVLAGDGKDEAIIRARADDLGLKEHIRFLGVRNDIDMLMQGMDVFVLPSKFEGLGIVFIEAQAAGLKCFASNVVPAETNVSDSIEYIALNEPPEYWAERILRFKDGYNRKDYSEAISLNGFDIKNESAKLQDRYEKLIKSLGI